MKRINPINLYLREEKDFFLINIEKSDEFLCSPSGNIIKSKCREIIEVIIYELQKFYSLELSENCSLIGDPIERVSHYSLISTQIDFWEDETKKFPVDEMRRKIKNDPLTNLSPGPEQVDQMYQWREIVNYLKEKGYDFWKLQYFKDKKEQTKLANKILQDFNSSQPFQKSIFIQLTHLLESIISSWVFVFGEVTASKFATIFTETSVFQLNLDYAPIEDELDEDGKTSDGFFPIEMFGKVVKDDNDNDIKLKEKKKKEMFREIEEISDICFKFKQVNEKFFKIRKTKIETLIEKHETSTVEIKSTFSKPLEQSVPSEILEHKVLQSIVGFLNNKRGGTLIIGIDDKLNAIGIDQDKFGIDYDKFRRNFVQKIENLIGKSVLDRIKMDIEVYKGKDCFVAECEGRKEKSELVYLLSIKDKKTKELFLRTEGKVVKLEGKDLADFIIEDQR